MTKKVELVEVFTDDWTALYENGINSVEGHRLDVGDIIEGLVGSEIVSFKSYWIDPNVIEEEYGYEFPHELISFDKNHLK